MPVLSFPVAEARISAAERRKLPVERRIGRFKARAREAQAFDAFAEVVFQTAIAALSDPPRMITTRHLGNAIAYRIPRLPDETRPLLQGYIFEAVTRGVVERIGTVSWEHEPIHLLHAPGFSSGIQDALDLLGRELYLLSLLREKDAKPLLASLPFELCEATHTFLGALVFAGRADPVSAPGAPLTKIAIPFSCM